MLRFVPFKLFHTRGRYLHCAYHLGILVYGHPYTPHTHTHARLWFLWYYTVHIFTNLGGIQKDSLTKDQQRKLEEAFGSDSTSSFTGNTLFDPSSGNLTGEFWDTLDNDEKQAMEDIQRMGNEGK